MFVEVPRNEGRNVRAWRDTTKQGQSHLGLSGVGWWYLSWGRLVLDTLGTATASTAIECEQEVRSPLLLLKHHHYFSTSSLLFNHRQVSYLPITHARRRRCRPR